MRFMDELAQRGCGINEGSGRRYCVYAELFVSLFQP